MSGNAWRLRKVATLRVALPHTHSLTYATTHPQHIVYALSLLNFWEAYTENKNPKHNLLKILDFTSVCQKVGLA